MLRGSAKLGAFALALSLPLAACEDSVGLASRGEMRVALVRTSSGPSAGSYAADLVGASFEGVELSAVQSIDVRITAVQVHRGSGEGESGWVTLSLKAPATLNLLALPTDSANGLVVAADSLEAGTYSNLRLRFDSATITFKQDVEVGQRLFVAGAAYPLTIPSGEQTGIKIPLGRFTVPEGGGATATIVFDASASVRNVLATGAGVIMTPVLSVSRR